MIFNELLISCLIRRIDGIRCKFIIIAFHLYQIKQTTNLLWCNHDFALGVLLSVIYFLFGIVIINSN